jgi:DNA-binding transcriptional LysR family regulator
MDKLLSMRAFRRVVETSSFTRAAEDLRVSAGSVSKLVAQLERDVGAPLLLRSTRSMSVTEAGQLYYGFCVRILDEMAAAEGAVQHLLEQPRGSLRVSVPTSFGMLWLSQRIPAFLRQHPGISLDLVANDQYVDMLEEGLDLALRIGRGLPDSNLVAKPLGEIPHVVVASPAYFDAAGTPASPDQLASHNCLVYTLARHPGYWSFGPEARQVAVGGNYRCNNSAMLRSALVEGTGVAQIPRPLVQDLLASGQLRSCLDSHAPPPLQLYAILPQAGGAPPKVRAFIDFIGGQCAAAAFSGQC